MVKPSIAPLSPVEKPKSLFVKNKEVSLNVTLYLKAKAETVILLHGGPGVPDAMQSIVHWLHQKYQVITFEQRGTGESQNPSKEYSIEGYIEDLEVIADQFKLDQFHIFGHSWGGLYAQIYADAHPKRIKSLFLCSPSSGTNKLWEATENEVLGFNKEHSTMWEFLQMGWYSLLGMFGSDSAYQSMFCLVLKNYHKSFPQIDFDRESLLPVKAEPINLTRPNIVKYKSLPRVEDPAFPIVITYGDVDIYGPSKSEVPLRFPTAKHIVIENSGHIPWFHNPTRFEAIVREFYSL